MIRRMDKVALSVMENTPAIRSIVINISRSVRSLLSESLNRKGNKDSCEEVQEILAWIKFTQDKRVQEARAKKDISSTQVCPSVLNDILQNKI